MPTLSFKTDKDSKKMIESLAQKKGINTSAYIKLTLKKGMDEDLAEITKNGLTVAEEMEILGSDASDKVYGPFKTSAALMKALKLK